MSLPWIDSNYNILEDDSKENIKKAIDIVSEICDYKFSNRKDKQTQLFKLSIILRYIYLVQFRSNSRINFTKSSKENLLYSTVNELETFCNNKDIQHIFCILIKSINFKMNTVMANLVNLIDNHDNTNLSKIEKEQYIEKGLNSANYINQLFCEKIKSIEFKQGNQTSESFKQILMFIDDCNVKNLISEVSVNKVIFYIVKKYKEEVCKFLLDTLNEWLTY